jgi:hypothetical protein
MATPGAGRERIAIGTARPSPANTLSHLPDIGR